MSRNSYIQLFPIAEWAASTGQHQQPEEIEMQNIDTKDTVNTGDAKTQNGKDQGRNVQSHAKSEIGGHHESDYVCLLSLKALHRTN
jgi:hypothetical protein